MVAAQNKDRKIRLRITKTRRMSKKKLEKARKRAMDLATVTVGTMLLNMMMMAVTKVTGKLNSVIERTRSRRSRSESPPRSKRERVADVLSRPMWGGREGGGGFHRHYHRSFY